MGNAPYGSPQWQILTQDFGEGGAGGGIPEAPTDGQIYGRQGSTTSWQLVTGGGGSVSWDSITGKPVTFPPSLPIPQSGVTNLVTDLGLKAPLASPVLSGTPTTPTAAPGTSTLQIASTAFVGAAVTAGISGANIPPPATVAPLMSGVAAVGATAKYAKEDHRHPTDTSREATIAAGTTAQYWRGDKSWQPVSQFEAAIAAGTTAQYWRGDKSWQALNVAAVTGLQTALDAKLALAGGTMTGFIVAHANPSSAMHVATKQYVDGLAGGMRISDTPPAGAVDGMQWWRSNTGAAYVFYVDAGGAPGQWVQTNSPGMPEAPVNGIAYMRKDAQWLQGADKAYVDSQDSAWSAYDVKKTGDTMTGALVVQNTINATGSIVTNNHLTVAGTATAGAFRSDAPGLGQIALYRNVGGTGGYGLIGNDGNGFTINATGQNIVFMTGGAPKGFVNYNTGQHYFYPATSTAATIYVDTPAANYAADTRGGGVFGACIGYCQATTYYGLLGHMVSSNAYSFYGNGPAFISNGTWTTSDARLKDISAARSAGTGAATSAVRAIPVVDFTWKNSIFAASADNLDDFGWVAQDVEAIIPMAVRDMGIAPHDIERKSALQEDATVETMVTHKAINEHYLLATLWAAVQELIARMEAMEARLGV